MAGSLKEETEEFKRNWRNMGSKARLSIKLKLAGYFAMALAIILAFGWPGIIFVTGWAIWMLGDAET